MIRLRVIGLSSAFSNRVTQRRLSAIVTTIRIYMIDDMFFRRFQAMKGRSHDNMNTNGRNLHVSVFIIGLAKSPEVIILTKPFTITRIPGNSSIISDRVFFIFINTLYLLLKIININHNLHYTSLTKVVINFLTSPTA